MADPIPEPTPLPATLSTPTPLPTPLPQGSWDTHFHIFPAHYPLAASPMFVPPRIPPSAEVHLHADLGTSRTVLVHSFTFGTDLSSTTDWLNADKANRRAIAVLADDASAQSVQRLHAAGVRGVRALMGHSAPAAEPVEVLRRLCARLNAAGVRWTVCVQELDGGFLDALAAAVPTFSTQQVIMVDHMGFLPGPWTEGYTGPAVPDVRDVPHVRSLLALLHSTGTEVYCKLSAPYRCTLSGAASYHKLEPLVRALAEAAPRRIIFGTDWPHTPLHADMAASRAAGTQDKVVDLRADEDMGLWLTLLRQWLGEETFRLMMVDNPAGLYA